MRFSPPIPIDDETGLSVSAGCKAMTGKQPLASDCSGGETESRLIDINAATTGTGMIRLDRVQADGLDAAEKRWLWKHGEHG